MTRRAASVREQIIFSVKARRVTMSHIRDLARVISLEETEVWSLSIPGTSNLTHA